MSKQKAGDEGTQQSNAGNGTENLVIKELPIFKNCYLLVDDKGHVLSDDVFEGAFGYVLRLHQETPGTVKDEQVFKALKIPKLIGATLPENAYIINLMREEVKNVELVHDSPRKDGIIPIYYINPLMEKYRGGDFNRENEFKKFDEGTIIFSCEAGERPRFSILGEDGKRLVPESMSPPSFSENSIVLSEIQEKAKTGDRAQTVFITPKVQGEMPPNGDKNGWEIKGYDDAEKAGTLSGIWYAYAPSFILNWVNGTLQQAVGSYGSQGGGGRGSWKPIQHIQLTQAICEGLITLHLSGIVHADIRPANIMYRENPDDPEDYLIVDFGSLVSAPVTRIDQRWTGNTLAAPGARNEHVSVFYAPERYQGTERENANRARVVSKEKDLQSSFFLALGWQGDEDFEKLDFDKLDEEYKRARPTKPSDPPNGGENNGTNGGSEIISDANLNENDRVQIQNYVFALDGPEFRCGKYHIYPCKRDLLRSPQTGVFLSDADQSLPDGMITVDRIVETKQWTAATDIYSLGVLLLYSIFHRVPYDPEKIYQSVNSKPDPETQTRTENSTKERFGNDADGGSDGSDGNKIPHSHGDVTSPLEKFNDGDFEKENDKDVENYFQEMLKYMASESTFLILWEELESLRQELEESLKQLEDNTRVKDREFPLKKYGLSKDEAETEGGNTTQPTIYDQTLEVTKRITQNIPHTRRIAAALDFDLTAFVFIIHFSMACLHRRSILKSQSDKIMDSNMPFCKNRREGPEKGAAAKNALKQLKMIYRILEDEKFNEFRLGRKPYEEIQKLVPEFKLVPASDLISKNQSLTADRDKLQVELKNLEPKINKLESLEKALNELETESKKATDLLNPKGSFWFQRAVVWFFRTGSTKKAWEVMGNCNKQIGEMIKNISNPNEPPGK